MDKPKSRFPRWSPEENRRRPRDLDPSIGEEMCERAANGETLTEICDDPRYPLPATFLRWCREDSTLAEMYGQAQEDQCDVMLEELTVVAAGADARVSRIEVEARRLVLEKKLPKKYGPRSYTNVSAQGEETPGGADAAEVRRKLEQMAQREKENAAE